MTIKTTAELEIAVTGNNARLAATLKQTSKQMERFAHRVGTIGRNIGRVVTLPVAALGGLAAKSAVEFESAFTGVEKTVNGTAAQLAGLRQGILDMSKQLPTSAVEIAGVAEAAGQLGIATGDILGFTRVMIDLGNATNITAQDAATQLARFANITGMSAKDFDRLGSTIVELGNNLPPTEAEIVEMGMRLGAAGDAIGLSQLQIMGFSAALSSVGVAAESGGTAFSQVFKKIQMAASKGGKSLEEIGAVAGLTAQQFQELFAKDAAEAVTRFVEGIGKAKDPLAVINNLSAGFSSIRLSDSLLRAANAGDLLRRSLGLATDGWERNLALTEEAEKRYGTMASELAIARNNLTALGIDIGGELAPAIRLFADAIKGLGEGLNALPRWAKLSIIGIAGFTAALGAVLTTVGFTLSAVIKAGTAFVALGKMMGIATLAAKSWAVVSAAVSVSMGVLGGVLAALFTPLGLLAAAVGVAVVAWYEWDTVKPVLDDFAAFFHGWGLSLLDDLKMIGWYLQYEATEMWRTWKDDSAAALQGFQATAAEAWEGVEMAFGDAKTYILNVLTEIKNAIANFASDAFSGLTDGAQSAADGVYAAFQGLYVSLFEQSPIPAIQSGLVQFGTSMTDAVVPAANSTTSAVQALFDKLSQYGGKVTDQLTGKNKQLAESWKSLTGEIARMGNEVMGVVTPLRAELLELMKVKDFSGIRKMAEEFRGSQDAMNKFREALNDAKGDLQDFEAETQRQADTLKDFQAQIADVFGEKLPNPLADQIREMISNDNRAGLADLAEKFSENADQAEIFGEAMQRAKSDLADLRSEADATAEGLSGVFEAMGVSSEAADGLGRAMGALATQMGGGGSSGTAGFFGDLMGAYMGSGGGGMAGMFSSFMGGGGGNIGPVADGAAYGGMLEGGGGMSGAEGWASAAGAAGDVMDIMSSDYSQYGHKKNEQKAKDVAHTIGMAVADAWTFGIASLVESVVGRETMEKIADPFGISDAILGALFGKDEGNYVRNEIGKWVNDQLEGQSVSMWNAEGQLQQTQGWLNFDKYGHDFRDPSWASDINSSENAGAFLALGESMTELLGVTQDVGGQIGYILNKELVGNLDNARLLVKQLGISQEQMTEAFVAAAEAGDISWHEMEVRLQGVGELFGEGLQAIGDFSGAFDQIVESGGRGIHAIAGLQNSAVEAGEAGITSFEQWRQSLLAAGQDAGYVDALFQALAQRGITTFEQIAAASNRELGGVIADMYSASPALQQAWDAATAAAEGLKETIDSIPPVKDIRINVTANIDSQAQEAIAMANAGGTQVNAQPFATGGVVRKPVLGMVGEAGPEAILPLNSLPSLMRNLNTGGDMGHTTHNTGATYHIDARGAELGVENRIMRALDLATRQSVQAAVVAVAEARDRGGNYGDSF